MIRLKRWLSLQVLGMVFALGLSSQANAQVPVPLPVFDGASLTEQVAEAVEIAGKWATQFFKLKQQYDMMVKAYDAITHARHLSDIFDNPALRRFLPNEWVEIYDDIRTLGYRAANQAAREIYEANRAFDKCAKFKDDEQRTTCEALAIQASSKKGLMVPAVSMVAQRSLQIRELQKAMGKTKDTKEAAEIQGRITAEQAQLLNSQVEMMMYDIETQTEKELLEQRAREQEAKTWAKSGCIVTAPLTFE